MNPHAQQARLFGLNHELQCVRNFAKQLFDRADAGEAKDSKEVDMNRIKEVRRQGTTDIEMASVCVARQNHVPDAGKMVDRLAQPAQPSSGPVKAGPDDFAVWSEEARKEGVGA